MFFFSRPLQFPQTEDNSPPRDFAGENLSDASTGGGWTERGLLKTTLKVEHFAVLCTTVGMGARASETTGEH
jgi:hypothetical protein